MAGLARVRDSKACLVAYMGKNIRMTKKCSYVVAVPAGGPSASAVAGGRSTGATSDTLEK